ncbi:DUF2835 family protein [Catenovulum agarivorans]|uniref:DUF2835 family protein n=1 Tax=Catenovulum agarivorans TaxID=1172192 RepID=UPI00031D99C1|nr:DUF2835 family protein [Catenovulum agarivorans]
MLNSYFFTLDVSYTECQSLYSGSFYDVVLIAENGVRVQVPINLLKQHINSRGIFGRFRLLTDQNNKAIAFERLR